ncbi:phosphopantothenoylcysteine decarboxylase/phosphopantothenoylcysteine decarboxylase / phosphopantothenate--cysteine ligase [Propionibacterium cyclohexanicum]|uniref:Phosphopantothenoylcysteine decarboxylase/phosphopantothenoylcysteine decarboxylase / phosphopantothenate--cysteine ligase n=1 Tax=Propionibacterium cyclohexanicum TaxID=64702 RepID=A0A1H9TS53_9ACTN|nr:flavoprotein [Propionibacterium cyclohexanicum]SER99801.1 phosphopantothenoylcysteine decarboxylase/phosphopantothenoylcysteine decarboxylase / phosphopantothenate--cysteine ligase [Propionibacterium cyclohexanicum]
MKNILLGVSGSIAAYKAADIANDLTKAGHNVDVILTAGGARFITAFTLQTLSGNPVHTDMFDTMAPDPVQHIALARRADLLLVAPGSADIIAKLANGIADDMLSTVVLALGAIPKLIAPAMNTVMYENPLVQGNIAKLGSAGFGFIEPRVGHLAEGGVGRGALADVDVIVATALAALG